MSEVAPPLEAPAAAAQLVRHLQDHTGDLTRADAASRSGLALHEVGPALHHLVDEYRGHLAATESGELLYRFPAGFTKPWERREAWEKALGKVGEWLGGALRFAARVWVTVALVGYAVLFMVLLIAGAVALSRGDDDGPVVAVGGIVRVLFELVFEAVYWSFHPLSPARVGGQIGKRRRKGKVKDKPFYEKVNGFFFGPTEPEPEEGAQHKVLLAAIRSGKGRIGLGDVMRVTGLPRSEADPLMGRLMVDYEGDVDVSDDGGIYFSFPEVRRTAGGPSARRNRPPPAIWDSEEQAPAFTGNSSGANVFIGLLAAFNVVGAAVGLNLGAPWWLAELPLAGAGLLVAWPALRAFRWFGRKAKAAAENARRRLLRKVLGAAGQGLRDDEARAALTDGGPERVSDERVRDELLAFGGELEITDDGHTLWRFPELALERKALRKARAKADDAELDVGEVVFASDR